MEKLEKSQALGTEKIGKLLFRFSIPAIVGMVVNALYNVVDRIFIGQGVGSSALTGLTIGFPIMLIMMAFGLLVGIGASALLSIRLGEQKKDEAEKIIGNTFILSVVIGILISIIGLVFLKPLLRSFGASNDALPFAASYLRIIMFGTTFQSIVFGMNGFIRGEGNPVLAMVIMVFGAVINILLDYVFIFIFGMGIVGAALATVIAQALSAIWILYHFTRGSSELKIHVRNMKLDKSIVLGILGIGLSPFLMQVAASFVTLMLNKQLGRHGGDVAIAAFGIMNSIDLLILMPIFGINQGSQPIIGYNYGAKQYDRVKRTLLLTILIASSIVIIGFIGVQLFSTQLISMFNSKDSELIAIGSKGIRLLLITLPLVGFQMVCAEYYQAVAKWGRAILLSMSRDVIFLVPAILILPKYFNLNGVWLAGPFSDVLSFLLAGGFIIWEVKNLKGIALEEGAQSLDESMTEL